MQKALGLKMGNTDGMLSDKDFADAVGQGSCGSNGWSLLFYGKSCSSEYEDKADTVWDGIERRWF